jgi:transcriptional regulator with XRE-family HTH domain
MSTATAGQTLARNLRRRRLERGISVSQLALAAGVSKATISGVERGLGNPAVDTVWALAQALNLPFGALFDDDPRDLVHIRRLDDAPVVSSAPGFLGRRLLTLQGLSQLELYVLELDADALRNAAPHPRGVIEHVIVISGKAEIGPNDNPLVVETRDYVSFLADRPHQYRGIESSLMLLLTEYPS